jgi:hypothetical protein
MIRHLKETWDSILYWPRGAATATDTSFWAAIKLPIAFQTLEQGHRFSRFSAVKHIPAKNELVGFISADTAYQ